MIKSRMCDRDAADGPDVHCMTRRVGSRCEAEMSRHGVGRRQNTDTNVTQHCQRTPSRENTRKHRHRRRQKMKAASEDVTMAESGKERKLWGERGRLEGKIEGRQKMIHNARERLSDGESFLWHEDRSKLEADVKRMQREIGGLREEITVVDEELRAGEESGWKEAREAEEEARRVESVGRAAQEISQALREAKRRVKEEEQRVAELEAELREVGEV